VRAPRCALQLDVRYAGQGFEVTVPFAPGWRDDFHRRHARRYGHADPTRALEVVTLRVRAAGGGATPPREPPPRTRRPTPDARIRVRFAGRAHDTPVWSRATLPTGCRTAGPAIVCEYSATTVVPPGWRAAVVRGGGLLLEARDA
jgi:N-methylhydantoinase A